MQIRGPAKVAASSPRGADPGRRRDGERPPRASPQPGTSRPARDRQRRRVVDEERRDDCRRACGSNAGQALTSIGREARGILGNRFYIGRFRDGPALDHPRGSRDCQSSRRPSRRWKSSCDTQQSAVRSIRTAETTPPRSGPSSPTSLRAGVISSPAPARETHAAASASSTRHDDLREATGPRTACSGLEKRRRTLKPNCGVSGWRPRRRRSHRLDALAKPQPFPIDVGDVLTHPTCGALVATRTSPIRSTEDPRAARREAWRQDGWGAMVIADRGRALA